MREGGWSERVSPHKARTSASYSAREVTQQGHKQSSSENLKRSPTRNVVIITVVFKVKSLVYYEYIALT